MQKILIADDHVFVRKGIVLLCQLYFPLAETGEVERGKDLMKALKGQTYTHLVLDLVLLDGASLDIIPTIRMLYPALNILVLTAQPLDMYRAALAKFGVNRFISKDAAEKETVRQLKEFIGSPYSTPVRNVQTDDPISELAPREVEVLHYILQGMRTRQIAQQLNITDSTASTYRKRIYDKTGTDNVFQLREWASVFLNRKKTP